MAVLWVWSYSDQAFNGLMQGGLVVWNPVRTGIYDGDVYIYNQKLPYRGSTIGISSANGTKPRLPRVAGFDGGGVHYRYITWPGHLPGGTCWTLEVPLFYPLSMGLILPSIWLLTHFRRRRKRVGRCQVCSYDLTGNISDICPECGSA